VHNPATGQQTGQVTVADQADVDASVSSAKRAAQEWRRVSLSSRAAVFFAFRELLHARAAELAEVVTAEHGKVLSDAEGEIARGLANVEFACGIPHLLKGGFSEQASRGLDVHSIRQPLGVVAGITPFNFPVMVPLWMCANAIACGNAFILKPSEKGTPA
jgi:malonate-semialdehyde dehydrogenase (acetylating)/methylmalonate-semialdehyde dehydrogenase